jgi:hypothetical protein
MGHVSGIITKGDLQKAPLRMWLFGLLSLIEMQLLRLIRTTYPDDTWTQLLSYGRLGKAQQFLEDRQRRNEAIDLAGLPSVCRQAVHRGQERLPPSCIGLQLEVPGRQATSGA